MTVLAQLQAANGEYVRLVNYADVEGVPGLVRIHVHGTLEGPADDGEWYVRVKQCGQGCSGIGFTPSHIENVFRQSSQIIEITLR